jgi:uncharacterized protein DUF1566
MSRQPFLPIVGLLKQSLTATSRQFLSVLAILVLVPAAAAAGDPLSSWDTQMNAKGRFEVLPAFDNAAVLDKETQLVWEQSPEFGQSGGWGPARRRCIDKNVGGRKGWRFPSVPELASLVDPSPGLSTALPPGHPFANVSPSFFWSATTDAENDENVWVVNFATGGGVSSIMKNNLARVWCVRGGMNADQY